MIHTLDVLQLHINRGRLLALLKFPIHELVEIPTLIKFPVCQSAEDFLAKTIIIIINIQSWSNAEGATKLGECTWVLPTQLEDFASFAPQKIVMLKVCFS